ncbi:MAG TPA: tetratricopeptide repeat protein [Spirochaetia bacterium]|nr:tetratricopeptide repeat protein [Spirochaetia bacterium]
MKRVLALLPLLVATASIYAQSTEKQLFLEAEGRFQAGNYELALEQYDSFLKQYPLSSYVPDVQFRRAVSLFRLGKTQEALDLFRTVEVRYSQTRFLPYVPFWIGLSEYQLKDWSAAATAFDVYLSGNDDSYRDQALLYKAVADKQLNRTDDARLTLVNLMNRVKDPATEPYALAELAALYAAKGDYQAVLDLLSKVDLSKVPEAFRNRLTLYDAEAFFQTGNTKRAEPLYAQLLSASPPVASVAYQRLFSIYQTEGDSAKLSSIVNSAEVALAGMPQILSEFWLRVGIDDYRQNKLDLAESYLGRIWSMRSSLKTIDPLVPLYLAEIYAKTQRIDQAIAILQSALPTAASDQDLILFKTGSFQLQSGKFASAKSSFDALLAKYSSSTYADQAAYLDAYASIKQNDFQSALNVIDKELAQAKGGTYAPDLLKLKALAEARLGNPAEAVTALKEYVPLVPNDIGSRVDLIKLYFELKDYSSVLAETKKLEASQPSLSSKDPGAYLLVSYMSGLALVTQKRYSDALARLRTLTPAALQKSGLTMIEPYSRFYEGWASYRLADYASAQALFDEVVAAKGTTDLTQRALYLAGWSAYLRADYAKAGGYFLAYANESTGEDHDNGLYMEAKSLAGAREYDAAAATYRSIYRNSPTSSLADDSLYEYAGVLADTGKVEAAAAAYAKLAADYPSSPLAESSLYKRGELLYGNKEYEAAKTAFTDYRLHFPNGPRVDAALYWGGRAALDSGEDFGAVLLWEKLIADYPTSSYRPDAMQRTAEIYAQRSDLQKALDLYNQLIAVYPKEAQTIGAQDKAQKIKYLLSGQSSQEAELLVTIGKDNGAETAKGRAAMIALSRLYIYKAGGRMGEALPLLQDVVAKKATAQADAAQAQYLIGEYYYRAGDLSRAANEFLIASTIDTKNADLTAASMFRAAQIAKASGNASDALLLAQRIQKQFPGTEWAVEAAKLAGALQ